MIESLSSQQDVLQNVLNNIQGGSDNDYQVRNREHNDNYDAVEQHNIIAAANAAAHNYNNISNSNNNRINNGRFRLDSDEESSGSSRRKQRSNSIGKPLDGPYDAMGTRDDRSREGGWVGGWWTTR